MKIKHHIKILTPAFCRGGRALLGLSQKELAEASGLSQQTVADFERGARTPHQNNLRAVISVFAANGVSLEYEEGDIVGIRIARPKLTGAKRSKPSAKQP